MTTELTPPDLPVLDVTLTTVPEVGAVLVEAGVPAVRELRLRSDETLHDLQVQVVTDPPFAKPLQATLARLDAGVPHDLLRDHDFELDAAWLRTCEEGHQGRITVRVRRGEQVLAEVSEEVRVAAPAHWPGVGMYPELLAAWVRPNARALIPVLAGADRVLEDRTGRAGLDGLQSRDKRRAWHIAEAAYEAVRSVDLRYIDPPASFERSGQRVRSHEDVLAGLGTCLDLAVLFAALLEQAGLHAFIVVVEGHAFAGAWLTDFLLPMPTTDDLAVLRKRLGIGEAVVFDSSPVTKGVAFDQAVRGGEHHLSDPDRFVALIDVSACRLAGVHPLALEPMQAAAEQAPLRDASSTPGTLPEDRFVEDTVGTHTRDRLEAWRNRLLDLSLRNRLLNLKETKRTVRLRGLDLPGLEDSLEGGRTFAVAARPAMNQGGAEAITPEALAEAQKRGRLVVDLTEADLDKRLLELYRSSRSSVRESGVHTLYLAIGILRWFESRTSEKERLAPLLLVPVELERLPAGRGYALRRAEDETRVNATLLEKLRKDFGLEQTGLDDPPTDAAGVDVAAVLRLARRAVLEQSRWDVVDEGWIGQFSFTKHLMWRDLLANQDALLANPVVQHLFEGQGRAYPLANDLVDLDRVDTSRPPAEILSVVPADPSQLQAILAASDGSSFVLQGPPGTGKSQTITNLIAQLLGEGKTVLFVSEKRAALEVVQRRIDAVGLGPFCLELHSHQASKKAVMRQLGEAFRAAAAAPSVGWDEHARELADARRRLDAHAARLAASTPFGSTVRDVVASLFGLGHVQRLDLPIAWEGLSGEDVRVREQRVERLGARLDDLGGATDHPWRDVARTTWDPAWARQTVSASDDLAEAIETVEQAASAVRERLGLEDTGDTVADRGNLVGVARGLLAARPVPAALLTDPDFEGRAATLRRWVRQARALDGQQEDLFSRWQDALLRMPLEDLEGRYQQWGGAFFLIAWIFLWGARSRLKAVARGSLGAPRDVTQDLGTAIAIRDGLVETEAWEAQARDWLGSLWQGTQTDWDAVEARVDHLERLRPALRALARRQDRPLGELGRPLEAATDPEALAPSDRDALQTLDDAWTRFLETRDTWCARTDAEPPTADLSALAARLRRAVAAPGQLRAWCAARAAIDAARELDLGTLVDAALSGSLPLEHLSDAWRRSALQGWWEAHLARVPELASFRGVEHGELIQRFQQLDAGALSLARQEIIARVAARVPDLHGPGDELGLLRRQLQLKSRHMPVRRLFSRIGPLLERIVPCALMSPLSVAQYLDPTLPGYDVVVFDEASQIPPWDAVGAIARGTQVIVVGDSKQLPPTTFFDAGGEDEDVPPDDEEIVETESILDEVVAAGLRQLRLRWHYRSEHESLIAFSNHLYYDNALHTFPSALQEGLGVELRPVPDGFYDRGRSRTNRGEAEAVVDEIVRLLAQPDDLRPSVGVVTFSMAQRRLIEDLLDAKRAEDRAFDACFSDNLPEPAFVKNLESVQGDERDVMLFSIGYGPDKTGKTTMNFGPLNRKGGERRLNVAVTRARRRLVVFSTLQASQIDLTRTRALGVAHLKQFLAYAEHGVVALDRAARPAQGTVFESPFEEQVHAALTRVGHTVHTQVGVSGYRIDLALVDPDAPGRYLLAIECDGATYHGAHGARERDRLRQAVLEQMGWRFHRVWSTDWWYEREAAERRLLEAVQEAIDTPRGVLPTVPEPDPPPEPVEDAPDPLAPLQADAPPPAAWPDQAERWRGLPTVQGGDRDAFYDRRTRSVHADTLYRLVEAAGPIQVDDAYRAIIAGWDLGRLGSRIRTTLDEALTSLPSDRRPVVRGDHLWPAGLDADTWRGFRYVPEDKERDASLVSPQEVANAAAWILERGISMSRESLCRECAQVFGASQLGRRVRAAMEAGVDVLIERGDAEEADDRIRWL